MCLVSVKDAGLPALKPEGRLTRRGAAAAPAPLHPSGRVGTPSSRLLPYLLQTNLVSATCLPSYSVFLPGYAFLIRCAPVLSRLARALIWEAQFSLALQISAVLCKVKSITCKITLLSPGYQLYQ